MRRNRSIKRQIRMVKVLLKVLIVHADEREQIVLRYLLEQMKNVEIMGVLSSSDEVLIVCQEKKIDLLLLHVAETDSNEMQIISKLKELKQSPCIVMLSKEPQYAVQAYDLGVLDFVPEPIDQNRLEKALYRVKTQLAHQEYIEKIVQERLKEKVNVLFNKCQSYEDYAYRLPVRGRGKISLLKSDDIIYCESQGKKVNICTLDGNFSSNYTLSELENRLDQGYFFRAHQAFIVNLNFVKEIVNFGEGSYILRLNVSDKDIMLSRSRARQLRKKLGI